ncbi:hypothetical protein G647_01594 [Cladophialophora carrionii CBS 160.54]|uniref:Heterokaryon incompatibility domain-containing protein n=1 Tax=Cladophialophora carrionii CBS 160.54 TaxID=1279043 RepID=V9DR47_9EURO|nr:uncharacterized protein G647_01594 [Cladophialophora carrionii CBS 160.54]ETI29141.1 hypothetical protein G647_01594 [Cladophialophora carrionii CBS 160.54]
MDIHSSLPTSQSFQLLELQPELKDSITIRLIVTDLHNAPAFDALSYTWENPLSQFIDDSSNFTDTAKFNLLCGGRKIPIKGNLHRALLRLRDLDLSRFGRSVSKYLFADAICINQGDHKEKAAQVRMMGEIFAAAEKVLGWLGPEDQTTPDVFTVIDSLSTIPRDRYTAVTAADLWKPEIYPSKLDISPLTYQHWLALVAFLCRPFSERVWIIQEMVAAKEIFLICGTRVYTWETVSAALSFLTYSRWFLLLHTDQISVANVVLENIPVYQKLMKAKIHAGQSAWHLFHARNGMVVTGKAWTLPSLLLNHRYCKSKDARDRVYTLLGIARKNHRPFDTQPHLREVEYSDSMTAQRLFTRTARSLLRAWEDLSFLSHNEGTFATEVSGLPSWVPDYSVECMPDPLSRRTSSCKWKAACDLK